ncbi:MAG: NADH-quinone oxidoreductase subunit N [Acidobacteria bacterium]|nr:NADH-quinone oxidoreductase subunit N [Acidobacteriota bacterium]
MTPALAMPLVTELALFALAVVVLLMGALRPRAGRDAGRVPLGEGSGGPATRGPDGTGSPAAWLSLIGLAAIFALTFAVPEGASLFGGSFVLDGLALFAKRLFLASAALSVLASLTLRHENFRRRSAEYHFAVVVSVLGMSILASARELILLFVAFEVMSIPLFLLTGFLKRDPVAPEAALKFFLVGTASSAIIVYGMSFIYGVTGSTALSAIPAAMAEGHPLMTLGMALLLAGLGFKIAAFPFHMWAPDTYEAANTPFVAWLSVAPKAAGFVAIIRLYVEGTGSAALVWMPAIAVLAGMTMMTGNLMAIPQQNIKRMLAYSGIAHIGYMLVGLAALSSSGVAMMLFYLVAYMFGNMGAFFVVQVVAQSEQSEGMEAYRGLAQRSPLLALAMLVFLLSLGGIPFVAGFWAKLYVFWAAIERGMYGLVFLGAVLTVVALYYYLLVARRMYIEAPVRREPVPVPALLGVAILVCLVGVVGMGVYPSPWVTLAQRVASTLFS